MKFAIAATVVICILSSNLFAHRAISFPTAKLDPLKTFKLSPDNAKAGKAEVLIKSDDPANCTKKNELTDVNLHAPLGSGIDVKVTRTDSCSLTAEVTVAADATVGKVLLWLENKDKKLIGTAELTINEPFTAGAIPPGLSKPQVDLMWSVLPEKIVEHNFGGAISKNYYAIEVVIGNNSAHSLQLVSVGFRLPSDRELCGLVARNRANQTRQTETLKAQTSGGVRLRTDRSYQCKDMEDTPVNSWEPEGTLLPTSSYRITRGSLETRELTNARNIVLGVITALGPTLTGFLPFFHNVDHRANFSQGINILSNPVEKGIELVWKDPKPLQRLRFDDQVLRDGLLVRNNTQLRTLAFFPKQLLRLPRDFESDDEYKRWKSNAREIRERLGKLVLIGDQIDFVNRISVNANPPGPTGAPPTVTGVDQKTFKQATKQETIHIQGANLLGANLSTGIAGIDVAVKDIDPNGRILTADISVSDTVLPGIYPIGVTTTSGQDHFEITIEKGEIVIQPAAFLTPAPTVTKDEQKVDLEVLGNFLDRAKVEAADATGAIQVTVKSQDKKRLVLGLVIPANQKEETYSIAVRDKENATSNPLSIKFAITKK